MSRQCKLNSPLKQFYEQHLHIDTYEQGVNIS